MAGFFGNRDEHHWHDHPLFWVIPAEQRFIARDLTAFDIKQRLIVKLKLVATKRRAQIHFDHALGLHGFVHPDIKNRKTATAIFFRII